MTHGCNSRDKLTGRLKGTCRTARRTAERFYELCRRLVEELAEAKPVKEGDCTPRSPKRSLGPPPSQGEMGTNAAMMAKLTGLASLAGRGRGRPSWPRHARAKRQGNPIRNQPCEYNAANGL